MVSIRTVLMPAGWAADEAIGQRRASGLSDTTVVEAILDVPLNYPSLERRVRVTIRGLQLEENLHLHFVDALPFRYLADDAPDRCIKRGGIYIPPRRRPASGTLRSRAWGTATILSATCS
jgi:hypothetical protein